MPIYIKDEATTHLVNELAKQRNSTKNKRSKYLLFLKKKKQKDFC